ncbi:MAG: CopD family protein [Proteobacteria bacterium]|nr:CopD family protein [Pseudomonadota bacterium]
MPSLATPILLCLHLLAATLWVGGMATFHFAVRPAAVETLEPLQRLRMLCAALGRFFRLVTAAIVLLLATGFAMVQLAGGMGAVRWHVHAMLGIALAMMVIFAVIRRRHHAQMAEKVTAGDWKAAGAALGRIRQLVFINLWLGVAVFVVAVVGRALP